MRAPYSRIRAYFTDRPTDCFIRPGQIMQSLRRRSEGENQMQDHELQRSSARTSAAISRCVERGHSPLRPLRPSTRRPARSRSGRLHPRHRAVLIPIGPQFTGRAAFQLAGGLCRTHMSARAKKRTRWTALRPFSSRSLFLSAGILWWRLLAYAWPPHPSARQQPCSPS